MKGQTPARVFSVMTPDLASMATVFWFLPCASLTESKAGINLRGSGPLKSAETPCERHVDQWHHTQLTCAIYSPQSRVENQQQDLKTDDFDSPYLINSLIPVKLRHVEERLLLSWSKILHLMRSDTSEWFTADVQNVNTVRITGAEICCQILWWELLFLGFTYSSSISLKLSSQTYKNMLCCLFTHFREVGI